MATKTKGPQKSFHIMKRFDVTVSMEITATDFDAAVATAKAMGIGDFFDLSGAAAVDSVEPLHGMAVSEI